MSSGEGESEGDCGSLFDDISVMVFFTRIYKSIFMLIFLYSFSFEEKCFPLSFLL